MAKRKVTGTCALCGEDRRLVNSHIIPASFYEFPEQGDVLRLHSSIPERTPKRAPKGIYDQIVCQGCEGRFSSWDDYAYRLLSADPSTLEVHQAMPDTWVEVRANVDYEKAKLFAISVLWRGHVSKHDMFRAVDLGPYAERARKLILENDPGPAHVFSTFFESFDETYSPHMLGPLRLYVGGLNFYKFHLARHEMHVKVDGRNVPEDFEELLLRPDERLLVLRSRFKDSSHHQDVLNHFRRNFQSWQRTPKRR